MTSPAEARVAVERNALAIMRGDLMQVMADLTPEVAFRSSVGTATLATTWKQVMGQWKLTAVSLVSAEMAG